VDGHSIFYLGLVSLGSPSLAMGLVSVCAVGLEINSSNVQEFKDTQTIVNKNSFTKKLGFIKNQFKN
jgi:hypothetical protein